MGLFSRLLMIPPVYFWHYGSLAYGAYVRNQQLAKNCLSAAYQQAGLSPKALSPKVEKRMLYYALQGYLVSQWFCRLRGKKATAREQINAIWVGFLTPLLDDCTDAEQLHSTEIVPLLQNPGGEVKPALQLAAWLYHALRQYASPPFATQLLKGLKAQDASLQQLAHEPVPLETLQQIVYAKGGEWALLYRYTLQHEMKAGEADAIYHLGALTQLTNDVFDVWEDREAGMQTLYTVQPDMQALHENYREMTRQVVESWRALPYATKHIERSLHAIMVVVCRGLVASQQLLDLAAKSEGVFKLDCYERKALICDMERWKNIVACMKWHREMMRP